MKRTPLKRYTRLRPMSLKRKKMSLRYRTLRLYHLLRHPICQVDNCLSAAMEIHHVAGRGRNYLNTDTFLAVCRKHHTAIHSSPNLAREKGLLAAR
jgi:hypothetical protein